MLKLYKCAHCGNIVEMVEDRGVNPVCCGELMQELVANTTDAAQEKHVPVIEQEGNKVVVKVGSVEHPMVDVLYIEWIILESEKGFQKVDLKPNQAPRAEFLLADGDKPVAAYEYCNLHGLWKADI